jgi:hypothetical protein
LTVEVVRNIEQRRDCVKQLRHVRGLRHSRQSPRQRADYPGVATGDIKLPAEGTHKLSNDTPAAVVSQGVLKRREGLYARKRCRQRAQPGRNRAAELVVRQTEVSACQHKHSTVTVAVATHPPNQLLEYVRVALSSLHRGRIPRRYQPPTLPHSLEHREASHTGRNAGS